MSDLDSAISRATTLVHEIDFADLRAAPTMWELADLSASVVREDGRPAKSSERLGISEWAEQIGWTASGRSERTLADMVTISRRWPKERRVEYRKTTKADGSVVEEGISFWQHREALAYFDGDVERASAWLASHDRPRSVRDATRSDIFGTGAIWDSVRLIVRARRAVARIPGMLAKGNVLGTESDFRSLRSEIGLLKSAMDHLDHYLAEETVIDLDALQAELDKILKEEA